MVGSPFYWITENLIKSLIEFKHSNPQSISIELDLQLIDSETLDLTPRSIDILEKIGHSPFVAPEILQSILKVRSDVRRSISDVHDDLRRQLRHVHSICAPLGVEVACAGTHPTAKHWERSVHPHPQFAPLSERQQFLARRMMIFGNHVHVGVENGETCIAMMNEFLYELPVLLALSASSPYWEGLDTGLASSRITFFESIPTSGHPYQVRTWQEFQSLVAVLTRAQAIRSVNDIWWDIRPNPPKGTLDIRICDAMPSLEENMALGALIHCLADYNRANIFAGRARPYLPDWLSRENKWRVSRFGIEAQMIVDVYGSTQPIQMYAAALLEDLSPYFLKHHYQKYLRLLENLLSGSTSYNRQKAVYSRTSDLKEVTRSLIDETKRSILT